MIPAAQATDLDRASDHWHLALLRHGQGRVGEAAGSLWHAAGIYHEAGEPESEGACLATLGSLFLEEGEHELAVYPLLRARDLLSPDRDLWAVAQVRLGLALCHAALGDGGRALREAEEAWTFCRRITDPDRRAFLCLLRARIAELTGTVRRLS